MGADSSLSAFHPLPDIESVWIDWPQRIPSNWDEFVDGLLQAYSITPDSYWVGISFGGLVAQKMTARIRPRGLLLVGSLQDLSQVWSGFRILKPWIPFLPDRAFDLTRFPRFLIRYFFGIRTDRHLKHFYAMADRSGPARTRSLCRLLLNSSKTDFQIGNRAWIHGAGDRIIPVGTVPATRIVEGAGHLLSMTHPEAVNEEIRALLRGRAENPRVKSVQCLSNYRLILSFHNGEEGVFDVKPYLEKGIFRELKNPAVFQQVTVFQGTLSWPGGQDFGPDTLYLESEKSGPK